MTDWKTIANASGIRISDEDLERVAPSLDALESAVRPLLAGLTTDVEPAISFVPLEESE
jgi:hypothetical protein